jgi:DNA-binding transcriptional LysR family regulator
MDWQSLRIFLLASRHSSLRAAADELGMSLPTLSRRLRAFEDSLAIRLFTRTPRGLTLTPHGTALAAAAAPGLERMAEVQRFAARLAAPSVATVIRISATEPIVSEVLAPRVGELLAMNPGGPIELRVENRIVSIALNDADIAIRLARPDGDSLMAKRVASLRMGIYASAGRAAAMRDDADAWRREPWLAYDDSYGEIPERRWIEEQGLSGQVALRTSSTRALQKAVGAGAGLAILPAMLASVDDRLAEIEVPTTAELAHRPVWAVWHRDRNRDRRLRAVVAWTALAFQLAGRT